VTDYSDLSGYSTLRAGSIQGAPQGFIFHHTGGAEPDAQHVISVLNQRGLGTHYVMDRAGNIFRTLPNGAQGRHMRDGQGPGAGLSNQNTEGMEIIARDDRDITPAQVESAKRFAADLRQRYPGIQFFGHGEVNPHKQATEGATVMAALRGGQQSQPGVPQLLANAAVPQPAQKLPGTLTDLIAQTATAAGRPDLIPVINGIRAGESRRGADYDRKDDNVESSFGPFQLNRRGGLGTEFERAYPGLDLRDARTIPAQTKFVVDYLIQHRGDTSPWHGYKGPMQASPTWGNSGYDPNTAVAARTTPTGTATPASTGSTATPSASGTSSTPAPSAATPSSTPASATPTATPVQPSPWSNLGAALASSFGGGSGSSVVTDTSQDARPVTLPMPGPSQAPNALPLEYQQGHPGLGAQLGQLASQPIGEAAIGGITPDSITAGAPGMTQLLGAIGTSSDFNYLDPRAVKPTPTTMKMPRLA
jgi:N-acetylmuramoyl-L-alanine amidase